MKIEFKKIEDNKYLVTEGAGFIDSYVKDLLGDLNVISSNSFNSDISNTLYEHMLSRYVSGLYIKQHNGIPDSVHHILITINIGSFNYNISVGKLGNGDELGYVNGITKV